MAAIPGNVSIAELERMLEQKQHNLHSLLEKRDRLQATLAELDAQMQGAVSLEGPVRRPRSRKTRPKNESPPRPLVMQVLGKHKKGLSLADLAEQVTATGYQSAGRNFHNVLYQCPYNTSSIDRDAKSGLYRLQK